MITISGPCTVRDNLCEEPTTLGEMGNYTQFLHTDEGEIIIMVANQPPLNGVISWIKMVNDKWSGTLCQPWQYAQVLAPSQAASEDPYQIECSLNHHRKLGAILDEGELIHS